MTNGGESAQNAFLMRENCVDEDSSPTAMYSSLLNQKFFSQTYTHTWSLVKTSHCWCLGSVRKLKGFLLCVEQIDQLKQELSKKESELLALQTKLETLNNQNSDCKQHIEVLKESLTAKEQRAAILQTEVVQKNPSLVCQLNKTQTFLFLPREILKWNMKHFMQVTVVAPCTVSGHAIQKNKLNNSGCIKTAVLLIRVVKIQVNEEKSDKQFEWMVFFFCWCFRTTFFCKQVTWVIR